MYPDLSLPSILTYQQKVRRFLMRVKACLQLLKKKRLIYGVMFSEDIFFATFLKNPKRVRGKQLLSPIYLNGSLLKVSVPLS